MSTYEDLRYSWLDRLKGISGVELMRYAVDKYSIHKIALAFSGGLDSLASTLLALDALPDNVEKHIVFSNSTNEIPESLYYTRMMLKWFEKHYDVIAIELMPEKHYNEFMLENFYKGARMYVNGKWWKNQFRCCYYLKEKPALKYYKKNNIRAKVTGLRGVESLQRYLFAKETHGIFDKGKIIHIMPLWNWSRAMVIEYVKDHPLKPPINPIYVMGFDATGCMLCPVQFFYNKKSLKALRKHYPHVYKLGIALRNFFLNYFNRQLPLSELSHPIINLAKRYLSEVINHGKD